MLDQNHGLTPLKKCHFCGFLKPMFPLFRKACLLYKTSKIVFLRFFRDLLHGNTGGYKGLQGVTKNFGNVFQTRTFLDTFSWSILHKNQS